MPINRSPRLRGLLICLLIFISAACQVAPEQRSSSEVKAYAQCPLYIAESIRSDHRLGQSIPIIANQCYGNRGNVGTVGDSCDSIGKALGGTIDCTCLGDACTVLMRNSGF